jgi:hypothetical protein
MGMKLEEFSSLRPRPPRLSENDGCRHTWNDGTMEYWNIGSFYKELKKNMIYEINPSWIEKTLIEVLKNSGSGKMPFPFMFWPIKYFLNFHSRSRKLLQTASMLLIAFREISQKAIAVGA